MILPLSAHVQLTTLDPASVALHPDCHVDGERVQAYRHEIRDGGGQGLQPILVVDGVAHDGNHRLLAYRCEGVQRVWAVVVKTRTEAK